MGLVAQQQHLALVVAAGRGHLVVPARSLPTGENSLANLDARLAGHWVSCPTPVLAALTAGAFRAEG